MDMKSIVQQDSLQLVEKFIPYYKHCGYLYILQHSAWGEFLKFGITSTTLARRLAHYTGSLSSPPQVLKIYFVTHKRLVEDRLIHIFQTNRKSNHREYVNISQSDLENTIGNLLFKDEGLSVEFGVPIFHYRPKDCRNLVPECDVQLSEDCFLLQAGKSGFLDFSSKLKQKCMPKKTVRPTSPNESSVVCSKEPKRKFSSDLRGIRFYTPPDSWYACAQDKYSRKCKSFGFQRYGGAEAALVQAKKWRNETMLAMQQENSLKIGPDKKECTIPKQKCIRYDAVRDCIWASVQFRREVQRKSFSCKRFGGQVQAKEAAETWRGKILADLSRDGQLPRQKILLKKEKQYRKTPKRKFYSACRYQQEQQQRNTKHPHLPSINTSAVGSGLETPKALDSMELCT